MIVLSVEGSTNSLKHWQFIKHCGGIDVTPSGITNGLVLNQWQFEKEDRPNFLRLLGMFICFISIREKAKSPIS